MKKRYLVPLFLVLVLSSCTTTISSGSQSEEPPVIEEITPANLATFASDVITDPLSRYTEDDHPVKRSLNGFVYPSEARVQPTNAYLEFWHAETDLDFEIVADKQIFNYIEQYGVHDKKYADLYWPVTLKVTMNSKIFIYFEVGMRLKGNTSRVDFLDDSLNFTQPISFKLSFNELFTESEYAQFGLQKTWTKAANKDAFNARDDRTFMGLPNGEEGMKKLDLKWNKSEDSSLIMQPYVFGFFQKHGIIAQNSTLTSMTLNNTDVGIVTVNEPINKHLLRRYFDKDGADGELYKVGWSHGRMGSLRIEDYNEINEIIGEENKFIGYEPGYDMKEGDGSHTNLINLMQKLKDAEGKSPGQYTAFLEEVVDLDSFLTYAALSYMTGNPDDMRNNGNNYYIFFNPNENNKAYFIPYDYDWSLNLTWSEDVEMLGPGPYHSKHQGNGRTWQKNRLYWLTIISEMSENRDPRYNITLNTNYQRTYLEKLHAYNSDPYYTSDNYNVLFNVYKNTYNARSGSDFDTGSKKFSPFSGTGRMTTFINKIKEHIADNPL